MKKNEEYTEAVKIAENAVRGIDDPKLKITAFRTILESLISAKTSITPAVNKENDVLSTISHIPKTKSITPTGDSYKKEYIDSLGLSPSELSLVYDIKEDGTATVVCDFGNDSGKSGQIQYVLLSLLANYIHTNDKKKYSRGIIRLMKTYGFGELPNLNAYLRSVKPNLVNVVTKRKKSENVFEITDLGINQAKKLVSEIVKNGGIVPKRSTSLSKHVKLRPRSSLALNILDLINSGFFGTPQPVSEVKKKLEEKECFYARGIIDEKIRRRFLRNELSRIKKGRIWYYVAKK